MTIDFTNQKGVLTINLIMYPYCVFKYVKGGEIKLPKGDKDCIYFLLLRFLFLTAKANNKRLVTFCRWLHLAP